MLTTRNEVINYIYPTQKKSLAIGKINWQGLRIFPFHITSNEPIQHCQRNQSIFTVINPGVGFIHLSVLTK